MEFIDLFAGIGGVKIGFEKAGFKGVFSNDFDRYAKVTFDLNYGPEHPLFLGDLRQISCEQIPSHDILFAGFPCQPFSVAGYRQGFKDKKGRGNLFFDITRILESKKPRALLLENVKNLKGHDQGRTIKIIYEQLHQLGYFVQDQVLNAMEYGNLPQAQRGYHPKRSRLPVATKVCPRKQKWCLPYPDRKHGNRRAQCSSYP